MVVFSCPIQCPLCLKWVDSLCFACKVDEMYFHVCSECVGTPMALDDALRVGYRTGYHQGLERAQTVVEYEKNKELS